MPDLLRFIRSKAGAPQVAVLILALTGCSQSPQEKYARFLAVGKKQLQTKDYSRAILNFRNAVQAQPKDAEAHYQLALASLGAGQVQQGVAALRRATELNPSHSAAQLKLAELMIQARSQEVIENGAERMEQVLERNPGDTTALFDLAAAEARLGKPEEAEAYLNQILAKSPDDLKSAIGLAQLKLRKKDSKGALEVMTRFVEQSPNSVDGLVALGVVYAAAGDFDSAEVQFRHALHVSPYGASALAALGAVMTVRGKNLEAEQMYKRLAQLPDQQYRLAYAQYLADQNRREDAMREFERLVKADPGDRRARSGLVSAYVATNRLANARAILDRALKNNPKDSEALIQRSQIYLQNGDYAAAQHDVEQLLSADRGSAQAHFLMSSVYSGQGDLLRTKAELMKALEIAPLVLPARIALANLLVSTNNPAAALETLNDAGKNQKRLVVFVVARTWALIALGNRTEARSSVDQVLRVAKVPEALLQDALLKLAAQDFTGSRASLDNVLKSNPEDTRALSILARTYAAQKQAPAAAEKIRYYVERKPNSARLQLFWGNWLLQMGKNTESRAAFSAAKAADPRLTAADLALARLDLSEGKPDDARQRLSALIHAGRQDGETHLLLANVEEASRNYAAAIEEYQKALQIDDRNSATLNNLAYDLSRDPARLDDALRYAQKALELAPDSSYAEDTLGWVYYRKGMYQLAAKELEEALAKESRPTIQYHLGLTYQRLGDYGKGNLLVANALTARPDLASLEPPH